MTEAREASWYEIALTHSQIVKIFVALLLCLVAAFFSGVWIGRDAASAVENLAPEMVAEATPPADAEGREIGQLNFFTGDEEPAEPKPAIDALGAGTTLVDDLTASAANRPDAKPAKPARQPQPEPTRVPASTMVAETSNPDAAVPVTREPAAPAIEVAGDLVVQVFSSNDAGQARKVLGRLASGGHPAFLSPVSVEGRTMYRVRIGPYAERSAAEQVADSVRREFKLDTWITSKST